MKAIVCPRYGPPESLQLEEVDDPVAGPGQVVIDAHGSSVNALDWRLTMAEPWIVRLMAGITRPKKMPIVGADVAGIVHSVGHDVTRFQPGDAVFTEVGGMGYGGFSEQAIVSQDVLAKAPTSIDLVQAAGIPVAGLTALQGLRDWGGLQSGERVMITGASGGVGAFAVQIAHDMGAHVTAITTANKLAMVEALGADVVIDRDRADHLDGSQQYDMIFECGGRLAPWDNKPAMRPEGRLVYVGGGTSSLWQAMILAPVAFRGKQRFCTGTGEANAEDLATLATMVDEGRLRVPIDRIVPLAEAPAGIRHLLDGGAQGKTLIRIRP